MSKAVIHLKRKNDMVTNNEKLLPVLNSLILGIKSLIMLAPKTLQPSLRMATAHQIMELADITPAKDAIFSIYQEYTTEED